MKYFESDGNKYVQNGKAKVRVQLHTLKPSPFHPKERTVKVFEVVDVLRENPDNPLPVHTYLALSFPNTKLNVKYHDWTAEKQANGGWVETQVPFTINDRKAALLQMAAAAKGN